ncbi:MAG: heparinase II/III family protein [Pirellulales bacterium]
MNSIGRLAISCLVALSGMGLLCAESCPKHEPEKAFPELKVYDDQGRPYRAAKEDWPAARRRVAEDPAWATWLQEERAEVDRWIVRHHDRVNWAAGWSNDFVSPKDGSKLIWTEAIPGEEMDHFASPSDPHVPITDKLRAAWVRTWRERHVGMMERAARLYRLTGDEKYAAWAASQLDFYSTHYLEWEPQRQGARLFWQSLTEGVNLITFAHTVRLLGDYVADGRRQFWYEKFFAPEIEVLNKNFPRILNITCWLRSAAAQVALIFGDEPMWREAIDGPFGIRQQVAEGITSDYLWYEQSLSYNSYVASALSSLFEAAGLYGRTDELALEMATVENLMLSTTYLRFPTGVLPTPSDTKGILYAPDEDLFAETYRVFPTTIGLATAQKQRSWNTLLDPPPQPPPGRAKMPPVTSRNLETSRMAVLKDGPWQVFFHYGQPPIKSHLQAEVLNFSAFFGDVDVTHDPGTVGYGSALHREYYIRGLNHNVPLAGGEGQEQPPKGRRPDPFTKTRAGELIDFSAAPAKITVAHPVYRREAKAQRTLHIEGDQLIDVATIETTTGKPQKLGLSLHLQGKVRLPEKFVEDTKFAEGRPAPFGYWRDVRTTSYRDKMSFEVDYGSATIHVTFAVLGEFRVWHASTLDTPPHRREGFYLETFGKSATFTTIFEPGK